MLEKNPDALTCDMAETYGVFNLYALPVGLVATLACGLRENSRIMMEMSEMGYDLKTLLIAKILDVGNILVWQQTKDGIEGRNQPKSIYELLLNPEGEEEPKNDHMEFDTPEEFEAMWNEIVKWERS